MWAPGLMRHNFPLADTPPGKRKGSAPSCWGSEGGRLLIAGCHRHAPCTCKQQGSTGVFCRQWPPVAFWETLGRVVSSCHLCWHGPSQPGAPSCSSTELSLPRIPWHWQQWEFQLWLHFAAFFCLQVFLHSSALPMLFLMDLVQG